MDQVVEYLPNITRPWGLTPVQPKKEKRKKTLKKKIIFIETLS
jgi:hypothetical protein